MSRSYRGFDIKKTGRQAHDWCCKFGKRPRWGTLEELKVDIDNHLKGMTLPPARENV